MHKGTHISEDDRSACSVGGSSAPVSSLRPSRGDPVILIHQSAPPPVVSGDAIEPEGESCFVPIGSIAIRLLAEWSLPRMKMTLVQSPRGRGPAPASAHDPWEE